MKPAVILLSALLFAAPALAGEPSAQAQEAPSVPLVSADALGELLKAPAGKVRVVNYWATWCGPCVAEMPVLRALAEEEPGVEVLLVNVDMASLHQRKVLPFIEKHALGGLRHVQLDDPDPAMALARVVPDWPDAIPVTAVYRADGTRAAFFPRSIEGKELAGAVAAAKGPAAPVGL